MIDRFLEIKKELAAKDENFNTTEIALEILKLEQQQHIWNQQKQEIDKWLGSGENRPVFLASIATALDSYQKLK